MNERCIIVIGHYQKLVGGDGFVEIVFRGLLDDLLQLIVIGSGRTGYKALVHREIVHEIAKGHNEVTGCIYQLAQSGDLFGELCHVHHPLGILVVSDYHGDFILKEKYLRE